MATTPVPLAVPLTAALLAHPAQPPPNDLSAHGNEPELIQLEQSPIQGDRFIVVAGENRVTGS
jgi:hypothetical protein